MCCAWTACVYFLLFLVILKHLSLILTRFINTNIINTWNTDARCVSFLIFRFLCWKFWHNFYCLQMIGDFLKDSSLPFYFCPSHLCWVFLFRSFLCFKYFGQNVLEHWKYQWMFAVDIIGGAHPMLKSVLLHEYNELDFIRIQKEKVFYLELRWTLLDAHKLEWKNRII